MALAALLIVGNESTCLSDGGEGWVGLGWVVCDDFEWEADVDAVSVEDFGEGFGADFLNACCFEGNRGKFATGAAAEVVPGFDLVVAKKIA